jgi:hypothetical protein
VYVLTYAQQGGAPSYGSAMMPDPAVELLVVGLALLALLTSLCADSTQPSRVVSALYLLLAAGGLVLLVVEQVTVFTLGQSYDQVSHFQVAAALVVLYLAYAAMLAGGIVLARAAWTARLAANQGRPAT